MSGIYRPRHPERTVVYRMLFHYFDRFMAEYESRFEKDYSFLRPIVKEVVERYVGCDNPRCGSAGIRCPDCGAERLLMFSCRTRGFCASCHAKRLEEWGEWIREKLLLDVYHRQVVFTIPKMLRLFFKYNRKLLGELCRSALRSLHRYFEAATGSKLRPGVIAAIQTFGDKINFHPHAHLLVTEGGEQKLILIEQDCPRIPRRGWAEMIKKVYERNPLTCPLCQGEMRIIAFLSDHAVVDRIINRLKLTSVANKTPPPRIAYQELLIAAETSGNYFS